MFDYPTLLFTDLNIVFGKINGVVRNRGVEIFDVKLDERARAFMLNFGEPVDYLSCISPLV